MIRPQGYGHSKPRDYPWRSFLVIIEAVSVIVGEGFISFLEGVFKHQGVLVSSGSRFDFS